MPMRPLRPWETPEDDPAIVSTSYFPDDAEARALKVRISERERELSVIDTDYFYFHHRLSHRTVVRRQALHQANVIATSLLSPVRKLPTEILGEIFTHALPRLSIDGAMKVPHSPYEDTDSFPEYVRGTLRRVCRHWNSVALSTPRFWTSLTISYKVTTPLALEAALIYSGVLPLDIYIPGVCFDEDDDNLFQLLLIPEVYRIQQLIYALSWDEEVCHLFPTGKYTDAPSLKVFAVTLMDDNIARFDLGNIHSPNLEVLALQDPPQRVEFFSPDSLRNLRRLVLRTPAPVAQHAKYHLDLLAQCPSVVEMEIKWMSGLLESDEYTGMKIPLMSLKKLVIQESSEKDIAEFLVWTRFPNLESLQIGLCQHTRRCRQGDPSRVHLVTSLRAVQAEASQSLQELRLDYLNLKGDGFCDIFPALVNLVMVHFYRCSVGDPILASLTPPPHSQYFPCPHLTRLTFTKVRLSLPGDPLVALVQRRTRPSYTSASGNNAKFTTITLEKCPIIKHDNLPNTVTLRSLARIRCSTLRIVDLCTQQHVLESEIGCSSNTDSSDESSSSSDE